jgi:acetylglutamate kinase
MVLSGTTNKRLVAQLVGAGVQAVGISGEDAGLFHARATDAATMGRVGGDVRVDPSLVRHLLAGGFVPVISPLARDADDPAGTGLNVNGDDAAAALAVALGAEELVLVADVAGVLQGNMLIPSLDETAARALIANGVAAGGMAAKLDAAFTALRGGVSIVRITGLDGIDDVAAGTRVLLHPSVS